MNQNASEKSVPMMDEQARKEARRRRRQKNQILAYSAVILLVLVLAVSTVLTIDYLDNKAKMEEAREQEQQELVDGLLGNETEMTAPTEQLPSNGTSSEETQVPTYEQKLEEIVEAAIEVMPIEDKVAGLFIVTPDMLTGEEKVTAGGEKLTQALERYAVGGVLYETGNVAGDAELRELIQNVNLDSRYTVFQIANEECGQYAALASLGLGQETMDADEIGKSGEVKNAYETGSIIGSYLKELGINVNLAPSADIRVEENSVLGSRCFGADTTTVAEMSANMILGIQDKDVTACAKHFPGMGSIPADSDNETASSQRTEEEFRENEFQAFKKAIDKGVGMVMVSNMKAQGLTGDGTPCSMSEHVVTDILRTQLGFKGIVVSGALNEKEITEYYTADQAAIAALKAGCDMLLLPEDLPAAVEGLLQALEEGTVSEARIDNALRRIYRLKLADRVEK